jgi:type VI secretion system VasD/TssJ family lipoprotein
MQLRWVFVGLAAVSCLTGCGVDNKGAPLALRVYQLAGTANFKGAEFFPLYNEDAAVLKADLLHRDDLLLAPGASKSETIMPKDNVTSIGVFGAYRGFQTAVWRVSFDVAPHKTTNVTVTAGHDGLVLKTDTTAPK